MNVTRYFPDAYKDVRGLELRLEKNIVRFITFWGNYEYMLQSSGRSGLARIYENRLKAQEELRNPNLTITEPLPRAQANLSLHTPSAWGPKFFGIQPASAWLFDLFFTWNDGGKMIINPTEPEANWHKIGIVDYSNFDLRASKMMQWMGVNFEVVLTVQNLLNQKRLSFGNMSTAQFKTYQESLHLPFETGDQHGNDKLGEWDKDHIDIGWFTAPLFLNPRRVLLGARINF